MATPTMRRADQWLAGPNDQPGRGEWLHELDHKDPALADLIRQGQGWPPRHQPPRSAHRRAAKATPIT